MIFEKPDHKHLIVTIADGETGDILNRLALSNDFCLITTGLVSLKSWQRWGSNTQLNVGPEQKLKPIRGKPYG